MYRTPLGLRAFARVFILILPILYGPYFGEANKTTRSCLDSMPRYMPPQLPLFTFPALAILANDTDIGFSVAFSVAVSMALEGLFHLRMGMEDPFAPLTQSADAVDVDQELLGLEIDLGIFFEEPTTDPPHESMGKAEVKFPGAAVVVGMR